MAIVDSSSSVEPRRGQSTVTVSVSSTVSASSPKVSMFGAKTGFVIPKNKLSGSLVPIFRGGGKVDAGKAVKEEVIKQVQRKTKWGTDLTQDAAVRKGRALAYQTRVEQITQQLKSGALEIGDDQFSQSPKQDSNHHLAGDRVEKEAQKFELLELERRELIGEILCLNRSYKAPPDYKPLLKECKVPIPVKAYPGYNFIGLLLGPESNTQKRLEEETGAKIRVYGTKADTREKHEITQADITEAQGAYEEHYVNVTADTYEKVDTAVALIELLVTPVSGNAAVDSKNSTSVAGDNVNICDQNQDSASGYMMTMMADVNQGLPQSMLVSAQSGKLQFQQPYSAPWFPVAPPNAPSCPPSGFMPLPLANNPIRFPPSPVSPPDVPYFGQPTPFSTVPRTLLPAVARPQLPMQAMQQPPPNQVIPPQNHPMPGQQPPLAYPVMSVQPSSPAPAQFSASQPVLTGTMPPTRPIAPVNPQPGSIARPLATPAPLGNSPGWSTATPIVPQHLRPNMTQMAPQSLNPPVRPQQASLPSLKPSMPNNDGRPPYANFAPIFPSQPSTAPPFTSVPPQIGPIFAPAVVSSSSGSPLHAPMPPLSSIPPTMPSPAPRPLPVAAAPPVPIPHPPAVPQTAPLLSASTHVPAQAMAPSQSVAPVMTRPPVPVPPLAPGPASGPAQLPLQSQPPSAVTGSTSSGMPSFSLINPPTTGPMSAPPVPAPKPLRPTSGDFTFQPLKAQVPASPTTPRPNSPSVVQNTSPVPLAAPQAPSFRPALQNPAPPVGPQGFPRPLAVNQQLPTQAPVPPPPVAPFPTNSTIVRPPPRFSFPNSNPVSPMAPTSQMGPPSISPAPQVPNLSSAMPARLANLLQPHQNQLPPNRPSGLMIPNQQLGSNPLGFVVGKVPSTSAGNQVYDPFSPTSISSAPIQQGGEPVKVRKSETDAEYEDLMASVGVK